MQTIDFLPNRYRERDRHRRAMLWRCVLLVSFGGVICAASLGQFAIRQSVRAELADFKTRHASAKATKDRLQALQAELAKTDELAALYVYLRHPWPCTQLLALVTQPLPETIVLTEMHVAADETQGRQPPAAAKPAAAESPGKQDLEQLRAAHDEQRTRILLTGTTADTAALNSYVAGLGAGELFQSARLTSLEAAGGQTQPGTSRFEVNLVVRPGYGQPGGPEKPLAELPPIARRQRDGRSHE